MSKLNRSQRNAIRDAKSIAAMVAEYAAISVDCKDVSDRLMVCVMNIIHAHKTVSPEVIAEIHVLRQRAEAAIASIPERHVADMTSPIANSAFSAKVTNQSRPRTNRDVKPSKVITLKGKKATSAMAAIRAREAIAANRLNRVDDARRNEYMTERDAQAAMIAEKADDPNRDYQIRRANRAVVRRAATDAEITVADKYRKIAQETKARVGMPLSLPSPRPELPDAKRIAKRA